MKRPVSSTASFERATKTTARERFVLRLYVAGATTQSQRALANLRAICDEELGGRYDLEVIDVYQQPALAKNDQILAVPTLIKRLPAPLRRLIGDLSDKDRVLLGLDLKLRSTHEKKPTASKPARRR